MKLRTVIEQNSPTLLAAAGIAGFITAIALMHKSAPKANDILEEMVDEPKLEKIKRVVPVYAPVAGLTLIATGCILASSRIHSYRYGALLALYTISEKNYDRLQNAILEEVGPKGHEKILDRSVAPDKDVPDLITLGTGDTIFFDDFTGRYFKARSVEDIHRAVNVLNEIILGEDFGSINEYYDQLGLPPIEYGDIWGWQVDLGLMNVRLSSQLKHDIAVVVINFVDQPEPYHGH